MRIIGIDENGGDGGEFDYFDSLMLAVLKACCDHKISMRAPEDCTFIFRSLGGPPPEPLGSFWIICPSFKP